MASPSLSSLWGLSLVGLLSAPLSAQELGPVAPSGQAPAGQTPAPAPPTSVEDLYGKWVPLDQVVIVVNGDIITQRKIRRKIDEFLAKVKNTTADEFREVVAQTQEKEVESLLIRQAGEDLGLPPEAVEAHVKGTIRDDRDEAGGAFAHARQMQEEATTALQLREDRTIEIYESSWRRKIAGIGSAQERTSEDRYIRPGHIAQRYRRIERTGRDIGFLARVGAEPATFELQVLLITPQGAGSMEAAAENANQAYAALAAGQADWDELVATLGELGGDGLTGKLDQEQIARALDTGNGLMLDFATGAEPNGISNVQQFPEVNQATGERRLAGFAIYKLLGRTPAKVPPYSDAAVQHQLRRGIQNEGDDMRWQDALDELKRTAYIWHPDIEAQRAQRKAALERRNEEIQRARDENAARFRAAEKEAAAADAEDR